MSQRRYGQAMAKSVLGLVLLLARKTSGQNASCSTDSLESCLSEFSDNVLSAAVATGGFYDTVRLSAYNQRIDARPRAIVLAKSERDVELAIRCVAEHHRSVRVCARSGGHGTDGYSLCDGGLLVDVSAIAHIEMDDDEMEARVGVGATLGDLQYELWRQSDGRRTTSCGIGTAVGVGGHALGGGIGRLLRKEGMLADQIVSARFVNASGIAQDAPADLLYALRGAGHNQFGIVTELRIRTIAAPTLSLYRTCFPSTRLADILHRWQQHASDAPDGLYTSMIVFRHYKSVCFLAALPDQSFERLRALLSETFPDIPELQEAPTRWANDSLAYHRALLFQNGLADMSDLQHRPLPPKPTGRYRQRNAFLYETIEQVQAFSDAILAEKDDGETGNFWDGWVFFEAQGGRMRDPELVRRSAFAHRDAKTFVLMEAGWQEGDDEQRRLLQSWLERAFALLGPSAKGSYMNHATSASTPEEIYGASLERLIELRRKYDPDDVFRFPLSVELA